MFRQVSSKSASKTVLSIFNIVKLFTLSSVNNSIMTLIEQREAVLCEAQFHLGRPSDEVCQGPIELSSGSTLTYRKVILCAE
jgi:hypothetical protein